jgi:hypothetical protein
VLYDLRPWSYVRLALQPRLAQFLAVFVLCALEKGCVPCCVRLEVLRASEDAV